MKKCIKRAAAAFMAAFMLAAGIPFTALAEVDFSMEEWNVSESGFAKKENFRLGREDARSSFFSFTDKSAALGSQKVGEDRDLTKASYQSLDTSAGQEWKFYYVSKPADRANRPDNDHITEPGYDDSSWDIITVPKSWEASYNEDGTFKYNAPQYTNVTYPWTSQNPNPQKPNAPTQFNPVGFYRTKLSADDSFRGKNVFISFEGVESAFYVWVNGHKVGFSEDSFTSKEFKIDEYLNYDGNDTLAVEVFKWSSGSWLEDQDMIRLAGIFRSVYLTAKSDVELRDFTIVPKKLTSGTDPQTDYNDFGLDIYASIRNLGESESGSYSVSAELYTADGEKVPDEMLENANLVKTFTLKDLTDSDSFGRSMKSFKLSAVVKNPKKWSAERPNLYKALITVCDSSGNIIETTAYRFGFRIVEINNKNTSDAQVFINGRPLLIKGVNLHETYAETGRYVPSDTIRKDVEMMKQNNFNAIRMSHYSHDFRYYDTADELGMYVMDETNLETHGDRSIPGSNPNYLPACLDRVSSMFYRSKNFPCVIMLSLGNEAGSGDNFRHMADWLKGSYSGSDDFYVDSALKGDLQCRPIHYEGDNDKADVKSNMYPAINSIKSNASENKPYIVCEYSHAMGNSNGDYQGYWDAFESKANIQGGFIWDWVDQSIKTYVKSGYAPSQIDGENTVSPIVSLDKNKISTTLSAGKSALLQAGVSGESGDSALTGAAYTHPTPDALNINGSITLEAWVYPADNSTDPRVITAKGDSQYQLKTVNGTVQFNTVCGSWNTVEAKYDSSDWAGKWHRVAAVYDADTQNAWIYIDDMSAPKATQKFTKANSDGTFDKSQYDFAVGRDVQYSGSRDWNGLIDNVRVYSKALTSAELSNENRAASDDGVAFWQDFNTAVSNSGIAEDSILSEGYYAYGGDWGDDPNDSNFCQNGIIGPDRVPHGSMLELKRVHQDYVFTLEDFSASSAKISIRSRALFTNASDYDFVWELKEDGETIASGDDALDIPPLDTKSVTLAFDKIIPKAGKEYFITAKFLLKSDTDWAKAGHEISAGQFELDFESGKTPLEDINSMPEIKTAETKDTYTVSGDDFSIVFDRASGTISSFEYKGEQLFAQDESAAFGPAPNFWRAPTDNDRGSNSFQNSATAWRYAGKNRTKISSTAERLGNSSVKITFSGKLAPSKGSASYEMSFTVYSTGEVVVDNTMTPSGFSSSDIIPAVGNLMQLASDYENITWYGRGSDTDGLKSESYADRKAQQFVDVYSGRVSDQHTDFTKTQTSGNKTDIRWAAFTNDNGLGVLFSSIDSLFEINAQHVTPEELTTLSTKHPYEANTTENVVVELNSKQIGVGFDPSWLDKGWYSQSDVIRPTQTFKYSYKLTPVSDFTAESANELSDRNLCADPISKIFANGEEIADFDPDISGYTYYSDGDDIPQISVTAANGNTEYSIKQATSLKDDYTAVVTAKLFGVQKTYTVTFKKRFYSIYLDEMKYQSGTTGDFTIKYGSSAEGNPLTVWKDGQDAVFEHGIGTHAESKIVYNVKNKGYNTFSAYVNLDREVYNSGVDCPGIRFMVYADSQLKYSSPVITKTGYGTPVESPCFKVDITGAKTVTLSVVSPTGGINNAHADWCDAKFESYANAVRIELMELLDSAQSIDTNGYSKSAVEAFKSKLDELKAAAYNPAATDSELKAAVAGYSEAVKALENSGGQIENPGEIINSTPQNGTKVINGKTVLYKDGKAVTGTQVVTVSGKTYAVVGGYVKTGKTQVVTVSGKAYVVNTNGIVQKGTKNKLIKVGAKSYIVNKSGVIVKSSKNKLVKVDSKSYIVNKKGIVQKGAKNKLVKVGKKKYIVNKKGVVQKNKKSIKVGKKTYKTNKKGVARLKK